MISIHARVSRSTPAFRRGRCGEASTASGDVVKLLAEYGAQLDLVDVGGWAAIGSQHRWKADSVDPRQTTSTKEPGIRLVYYLSRTGTTGAPSDIVGEAWMPWVRHLKYKVQGLTLRKWKWTP